MTALILHLQYVIGVLKHNIFIYFVVYLQHSYTNFSMFSLVKPVACYFKASKYCDY